MRIRLGNEGGEGATCALHRDAARACARGSVHGVRHSCPLNGGAFDPWSRLLRQPEAHS